MVEVAGLRVVAAPDTWCDLGELVARGLTVDDLVVAGDEVLNRLGSDATTLREALARRRRPRGLRSLDEAVALSRQGVRSPMETRARLMFVEPAFPSRRSTPRCWTPHGGWLLEGDLVWREQRVVGEYQGSDHALDHATQRRCVTVTTAAAEGYRILEIYAEDVYRGARRRACLTRFARALQHRPVGFASYQNESHEQ